MMMKWVSVSSPIIQLSSGQHIANVPIHPPLQSPVGEPHLLPLPEDVVVVGLDDVVEVVVGLDDVVVVVDVLEEVVEVVDDVVMPVVSDVSDSAYPPVEPPPPLFDVTMTYPTAPRVRTATAPRATMSGVFRRDPVWGTEVDGYGAVGGTGP